MRDLALLYNLHMFRTPSTLFLLLALLAAYFPAHTGEQEDLQQDPELYKFEDTLLDEELVYPDWFVDSFGDLNAALVNAREAGKKGLIVYFGQKRCSYCEKFLKYNLEAPDISNYLQNNFDVVPIDIWGIEDVVMLDGDTVSEREYSVFEGTNFTPSLIFYDLKGEKILRLRGYYPPYKFRAALKYLVEGFYKKESLRDYMARADPGMIFDPEGLNEQEFFTKPPLNFDRTRFRSELPLVVFFEQGKCHACDVLHTGPLTDKRLRQEVEKLESAQLDMWSDVPVVTPQGKKTTAREWASELGLFYAPAMVFFDESGNEVMRVDAVTQFYRLLGVFDYVNNRAYRKKQNYQDWRLSRRELAN